MESKQITSISIKPGLVAKVDKLAQQCGLSRSECICRVLSRVMNNLARPEVAFVSIRKTSLMEDTLEV
jgi:metal-responsive CopG/Arc/MetJ family transcriptional regulator